MAPFEVIFNPSDFQEDVSPFLNHLYSVNIATSNVEETPNILKYLDENKSEFIQGKLNT